VEGDVGDRLHAAEGQGDIVDFEQHLAPGDAVIGCHHELIGGRMRVHSAASGTASAAGGRCTLASAIFTVALMLPLRPSSNVTSVETNFSVEPSYSASISSP